MTEKIPTLKPDTFKKLLMADIDHFQLDKPHFNDFYIHDLSKTSYRLKLPLPPHRKTVNDFILVTSGSMTKSAGVDIYEVTENSIFLLPAGQITSTTKISYDFQGFYVHFSNSFISESKSQIDILKQFPFLEWLNNPVSQFTNSDKEILTTLLKRLENIYTESSNYELIKIYLLTFLTELKFIFTKSAISKTSASERLAYEFKHSLTKHIKKEHEAEYYAKQLSVSPNHLNKCIKEVFGKSASQTISEYLILEAKVLLHQPSISISEISFSIGFDDPSYFGRFFKKHTGYTPKEFRKMIDLSD
ncbi:MAG: helix-turn-helix domain-containing protein [Spirosomaceae bacterium]|jgi:AraC-like DNA-binding protein|nr:helix-turn-helix domain-containing protein [Spirosomataceae bacterium]